MYLKRITHFLCLLLRLFRECTIEARSAKTSRLFVIQELCNRNCRLCQLILKHGSLLMVPPNPGMECLCLVLFGLKMQGRCVTVPIRVFSCSGMDFLQSNTQLCNFFVLFTGSLSTIIAVLVDVPEILRRNSGLCTFICKLCSIPIVPLGARVECLYLVFFGLKM